MKQVLRLSQTTYCLAVGEGTSLHLFMAGDWIGWWSEERNVFSNYHSKTCADSRDNIIMSTSLDAVKHEWNICMCNSYKMSRNIKALKMDRKSAMMVLLLVETNSLLFHSVLTIISRALLFSSVAWITASRWPAFLSVIWWCVPIRRHHYPANRHVLKRCGCVSGWPIM